MRAIGARPFRQAAIAAALAHWACACSTGPLQRPDPAPSPTPAASASGGTTEAPPACSVRRAARIYVGFSPNMSLDDFELAAFEAEQILAGLGAQLCALSDEHDREARLRGALHAGALEATSIVFTRDDAGAAAVRVRRAPPDISPPRSAGEMPPIDGAADARATLELPTWLLELVRTSASGWQVVSVLAQDAGAT